MNTARFAFPLAFGLLLAVAPAVAAAVVVVDFAWMRPAAKEGATEAFMELTSVEGGALVGARSNVARSVEIVGPDPKREAGVRLALPASAPVILAPGSYRIRLARIDRALKLGDWVPLVLIIEESDGRRTEIAVQAEVRRRSAVDDHLSGRRH